MRGTGAESSSICVNRTRWVWMIVEVRIDEGRLTQPLRSALAPTE